MEDRLNPVHLMSAQEVVASTLAGTDISVMFDAESPWADLDNRVIHLRPIPDQLPEEVIQDVRGDCDHELGHIIHTSPVAISGIKRPLVRTVASSIEDGRIERLVALEWFGCGENLEASSARAVARIAESAEDSEPNRRARAICGLSLLSYGHDLDAVVSALGRDIAPYYQEVSTVLERLPTCGSTDDVITVATEIVDTWKWEPSDQTDLPKTSKARESAVDKEISAYSTSPAERRKETVAKIGADPSNTSYRAKTANDKVETIRSPSFEIGSLYGTFFEGVRKTAPVLRRRLLMEFLSSGHVYKRLQKRGELDERNLWRYGLGDDRLYKMRVPSETNRSIVSLLVDCSASMTRAARPPEHDGEPLVFRTRLFIAAQAAAAVSSTLDTLGVPNEVLAFTTTRRQAAPERGFDRVRALRHLIIKPFHKSFRSCRSNFVSLSFFEHCSENIDGEAVLWASRRLLSKPDHGDSPVLMVFSDGEPASSPENRELLCSHLRDSLAKVERAGITVFGVGVGSDAVQQFYKNAVVVYAVSNLLTAFYDLLEKVLRHRRRWV